MSEHNTRSWRAVESESDVAGQGRQIKVTGEFEFHKTNEVAHLKEAESPGINSSIFLLDLEVTSSGAGGDQVGWKPVNDFAITVSAGQYASVTINENGKHSTDIMVEQNPSFELDKSKLSGSDKI